MTCLCPDFQLRGQTYEIWTNPGCPTNRVLVKFDASGRRVDVDTDTAFDPPLTNEELLSIYDYGKGY